MASRSKKVTPEQLIKNAILEYLDYRSDVYVWPNDSIGIWDSRGFYRKKSKHFVKGTADILGFFSQGIHAGKFLAIEVKSEVGKPTQEQKEFLKRVNEAGGLGFVARSPGQAHLRIETYIRIQIHPKDKTHSDA